MGWSGSLLNGGRLLLVVFAVTQACYFLSLLVTVYFYSRPVNLVRERDLLRYRGDYPPIVVFYPVLRELEETMRTTLHAIDQANYPRDRYAFFALPNHDDHATISSLQRLRDRYPWLRIHIVPPTSDPSWRVVWDQWEQNPNAYWWHEGIRAGVRDLPPKKTRQLIYAFYNLRPHYPWDTLISYLDADSVPPPSYFLLGAAGMARFDVVQLTNVAGNLLNSWAATFHAFDHMCWDASMYPHMTANGKHPFYVLGKGLFFRYSDLLEFGGFHPWLTIEDPEVGMRLWANGRHLGVALQPLVEEVPETFRQGVIQRKRWVCGFLQSLSEPIALMGMTARQRFLARLNLVPCLSLLINPPGLVIGIWVLEQATMGHHPADPALTALCAANITGATALFAFNWINAIRVSSLVLSNRRDRWRFALRINPLFVMVYWLFWSVSLAMGIEMFLNGKGLVWERTEKSNANGDLVRVIQRQGIPLAQIAQAKPLPRPILEVEEYPAVSR
jgi:glycosyltransferase XagB